MPVFGIVQDQAVIGIIVRRDSVFHIAVTHASPGRDFTQTGI